MAHVENPILRGCYPDPSICRVGDTYYLTTSTFEYFPGLPIFRSKDLARWEQIGHAVTRAGQLDFSGVPSSRGLFAPTIRHHRGTFYLICTLVGHREDAEGGNFLITATDPAGPWSDPVFLDVEGIDPSIYFDDDGRVWVQGTRLAPEPEWRQQTQIWLREYDPRSQTLSEQEHILWNGALIGAVWTEAPHLFKKDGAYYLLTAEAGTAHHHAVVVAESDRITGPYRGNPGNPVMTHRHLGKDCDVVSAGHADLVEAPDGSWWAVLLGMRPFGGYHYNLGRETFLVPVVWEDGWPVFAPGEGRIPHRVSLPGAAEPEDHATPNGSGSGVVLPSDHRWTALRGPISGFATPNGEGWDIDVGPATLTQPTTPAFLGVRQQHFDVDVRAALRVDGLADGEQAGVVIRQSEADHVTLTVTPMPNRLVLRAIHVEKGEDTVLHESDVEPASTVTLGISARGQDYSLTFGEEMVARVDGRLLDTVATGGFLGLWFGVTATSEGSPTGSTVRLEHFDYVPA